MIRPAAFLIILLATAFVSGVAAYVGVWTFKVSGCRTLDRPDAFLAYCDTPAFGSYEHAAYKLGVEPDAVRSMQAAEVLFLGNSRLLFAFSTAETDRFFREVGATYHLLGFGYGESSAFPRGLIDTYRPHPRFVVINADPFFQPRFSPAAYELTRRGWTAWIDAGLKKAFGRLQPWLCLYPSLCPGSSPSTYRDTATGQWIWRGLTFPSDKRGPAITATKAAPWREESVAAWVRDAETFLAPLSLPRSCVILVGIPTPHTDSEGMAAAIGRRLGVTVVDVNAGELESLDGNHLTADSADRWSSAFFSVAGPAIKACLHG